MMMTLFPLLNLVEVLVDNQTLMQVVVVELVLVQMVLMDRALMVLEHVVQQTQMIS